MASRPFGENGFIATTPSLVIDRSAKPAKDSATSTTITGVDEDATFYACFITSEEDKASIALEVNGEEMAAQPESAPYQTNVWAGVYLEWPVAASALSAPTVKVAGLPAGLKFAAKPVTSKIGSGKSAVVVTNVPANTIYGAPTAASKVRRDGAIAPYQVKVTVTTAGKSSQTYQIDTVVDALPAWAQGAFAGGLFDGEATGGTAVSAVQNGRDATPARASPSATRCARGIRPPSGVVSLTVAANGKISGKALGDGKTWTLSAPWFDEARLALLPGHPLLGQSSAGGYGDGSPQQDPESGSPKSEVGSLAFHATVIAKAGKEVATNAVTVAVENGVGVVNGRDARSPSETGETPPLLGHRLRRLAALGGYVLPVWTAWQYNWKVEPWKTEAKAFNKKTMTYAILPDGSFSEDEEDVASPLGATVSARVTLKFTANGTASVAGEFVTGYDEKKAKYTTVKATGSATLVPSNDGGCLLFVYLTPKGLAPHARCLEVPRPF